LICRQNKQKRLTYGTLTQIPFTLYDNKKNLIFETIHFRLYAVAEAGAVDDTLADRNLETVVPFSGFFLSVVGVVVMA